MNVVATFDREAVKPDRKKLAKELIRLLELFRQRRKRHEGRWVELAEYLIPDREIIMKNVNNKGKTTHANVYDDIGTHCLQVWADGILGYTASPGYKWNRFKMRENWLNSVPEVKRYTQDFEEVMYDDFKNGGLYKALGMFLRDLGSIGTAHCYVGERVGNSYPLYKMYHPIEMFIGEDEEGQIDIQFREYYITVRNLVKAFGEEAVNPERLKLAEKNPLKEIRILWAIIPREERIEGFLHQKDKKFASYYLDIEKGEILEEGGFDDLPIVSARCILDAGEEYGRSPGSNSIRDVKMSNLMSKANLLGAQGMVDRPLDIPIERRGKVNLRPGGRSYYQYGKYQPDNIRVIETGSSLPAGEAELQQLEARVKRHYFYDFFLSLLMEQKTQTAYEVAQRMGEKAVVLGPIIFQYMYEGLDRFMDRSVGVAQKAGRLPVPPPIIEDRGMSYMDVEYLGPLAQAQRRLFKTQGIVGFMETAATVPSREALLDRINWDEVVEDLADAHGVPEKDIRTDEEVKKIREQRAQLQGAMQQADLSKTTAEAGEKMAKKPEAGSPLEQLMLAGGGAG